jgi:Bacterial Ig-like domain (group 1)
MRILTKKWNRSVLSISFFFALALMSCEPGKSLDPIAKVDTSRIPKIEVVSFPATVLPTDTGSIQIAISDSITGAALKGARISINSTRFAILSAAGNGALDLDSVPDDGKVSFRIFSSTPGTGTVTIKVTSGTMVRSIPVTTTVTERPVAPKFVETLPQKLVAKESTLVVFQVLDSAQERPLANAVVNISSSVFSIYSPNSKDTLTSDTTGSDGKVSFRVLSLLPGTAGTLQVKVKTAAGISRQITYTLSVAEETSTDRPRKMVFTASRSTLRADGTDSTDLRVLVKDDNNNPLNGEKITFTATGGVVMAEATTDAWGIAIGTLRSERVNRSVIVTATLAKTGITTQQTVAFDGINITIAPYKRVLMVDSINPILFELRDGGGVPMSGDSLEIVVTGANKGFGQSGKDSMIVITDTKGQYRTSVTSHVASSIIITARALGAKTVDTVVYNSNILSISASKLSISGDGIDQSTITANLKTGLGADINGAELRWTTTFGTFTTKPFSTTASGSGVITLKSPRGSGLATVNVEAYQKDGKGNLVLLAGGNITIPVKALVVSRLELKVTPDNIPVKIGETRLIAQAFDSSNNVMTGVLISFRLVTGAGGGDETISPPIDYTKAGQAEATLKAGGVISQYRGVKLAAVALDISGTDTLIIASSDTVGLTVSGPPHRVSVGVNILKGQNENDGTFALPSAAVVTDVNGNLVADGTPVNFSTTPIAAWYPSVTWKGTFDHPYYVLTDTIWHELEWGDYNNNRKLDADEVPAYGYPKRVARGEDKDGNGFINFGPEGYTDINGNGVWDSAGAEPDVPNVPIDTATGRQPFVDFNLNGIQDSREYFSDDNGDGKCQCTGQIDANGNLYEETYFGSTSSHPFPGEVAVGVTRQVVTVGGKALTKIVYVQSMARRVSIKLTAESNGIRSTFDVYLPIVKDE